VTRAIFRLEAVNEQLKYSAHGRALAAIRACSSCSILATVTIRELRHKLAVFGVFLAVHKVPLN
jgi:hypothetical protein